MKKVELETVLFELLFPEGVTISNPPDISGKYIPFMNAGARAYLSGPGNHVGGMLSCPDCKSWIVTVKEDLHGPIHCRCGCSFTVVISDVF
jgi:hypothetical protein